MLVPSGRDQRPGLILSQEMTVLKEQEATLKPPVPSSESWHMDTLVQVQGWVGQAKAGTDIFSWTGILNLPPFLLFFHYNLCQVIP